jgi:hypothetical protein
MLSLALKLCRVVSILLLLAGLILPWYRVPSGLRTGAKGDLVVSISQPGTTIIFKLLLAAVFLGVLLYSRRKSITEFGRTRVLAGGGMAAALLVAIAYPALTIQRSAKVAAHGEWLAAQNNSMILSNGDSLTGEEYSYQSGQPAVLITEVLPRSFQALPTPQFESPFDLHLTNLPAIAMWAGYTPGFCQFIGRGWFCTLFGYALFAVSFLRAADGTPPQKLLKVGATLLPVSAAGACLLWGVCLLPVLAAGLELTKAETAADEERFSDSRRYLELATLYLPVLAYNTDIVFQTGWLDQKLGTDSPAARLVKAIHQEEEGFSALAADRYAGLLDPTNPEPVRGEAYRDALRLALKDLNAGLNARAGNSLTQLLAIDPSCIKANYALQLGDLRTQRKADLERNVAQFEVVYNTFQSLEKSALIAAAHRRLAELDFDYGDIAHIGDELRAAIKP